MWTDCIHNLVAVARNLGSSEVYPASCSKQLAIAERLSLTSNYRLSALLPTATGGRYVGSRSAANSASNRLYDHRAPTTSTNKK